MKTRSIKYPLLAAVALVWGLIIFKVVNGLGNNETIKPMVASQKKINYNQPVDSFTLISDYPDPFIPKDDPIKDEGSKQPEKINVPVNVVTAAAPPKPAFDPATAIQYNGMIENADSKLKVAILNYGGKEWLAREKEKVGEFKVKSIEKDKVTVIYKGVAYTIERTN